MTIQDQYTPPILEWQPPPWEKNDDETPSPSQLIAQLSHRRLQLARPTARLGVHGDEGLSIPRKHDPRTIAGPAKK
jgi:hypothetical protein